MLDSKKETNAKVLREYIDYHDKYSKTFGEDMFILMEVGSFYEIYSLESDDDTENSVGADLEKLSELTNMNISNRGKIKYNDTIYKLMICGFPVVSQEKYINNLLSGNCTVVLVDQVGENPDKTKKREVTRKLSPGTAIDLVSNNTPNANNVICIVFNKGKDPSTKKDIFIAGVSIVDFMTGKSYCMQIVSEPDDSKIFMDECYRIIHSYSPKEIIFGMLKKEREFSKDYLIKEFECSNIPVHYLTIPERYCKISFIEELLSSVYKNHSCFNTIDYLDLSFTEEARISFTYLLQFAFEHDSNIIEKLSKPVNERTSDRAVISSNAIHQLDMVNSNKNHSLMKILNKCVTMMGRRKFQYSLLHPTTNIELLTKRYDTIDLLRQQSHYKILREMKNIIDIERIHRRIGLQRCHPDEMLGIITSYDIIDNIIKYTCEHFGNDFCYLNKNIISTFSRLRKDINDIFDTDQLIKFKTLHDVSETIFNNGVDTEIEHYSNRNIIIKGIFQEARNKFSKMVDDNKFVTGDCVVKINWNNDEVIELFCTENRGKKLKKSLNSKAKVKLSDDLEIPRREFKVYTKNKKAYVSNPQLTTFSNEYMLNMAKMKRLIEKKYNEVQDTLYKDYSNIMDKISIFLSELDISATNAKTSIENGYCRPELVVSEESFVECKELRHPIVEKLQCNQDQPFIPNDISLNSETKGILLYGTNACGKSTLMKALGLSLIMAQCGMFVPANKFKFSPYENFFTRILGNDNIYRGLSSFAVEMTELRSILKRMNKKSLILGDEVCNGTESISALAIVSSTIMKMTEKHSNYIFATHLHELNGIDELNEIKTMKRFHLKIRQENDLLIYDRKLEEGSGDAIYGLKVARAMDMDETFLTNANKILLKLTRGKTDIVEHNPSHYNAHKNVALCEVCGDKAIDTHHIQEQNEANSNGMIGAIHKNRKSNLTALCKKCHLEEHHGNLNIKGYIETSEGTKLDYEFTAPKEKKKKGKYTDHQIVLIKNIRHQEPSMSLKYGVQELKKLDIDISVATLRKYWKD